MSNDPLAPTTLEDMADARINEMNEYAKIAMGAIMRDGGAMASMAPSGNLPRLVAMMSWDFAEEMMDQRASRYAKVVGILEKNNEKDETENTDEETST